MASRKSYGKKMGWRGRLGGRRKTERGKGSAPFKGGLDRREISLKRSGQVRNALEVGAVKIKNGEVKPVKGKSHISDGRLYYDE